VFRIPSLLHRNVKQITSLGDEPNLRRVAIESNEETCPFHLMSWLESPWSEDSESFRVVVELHVDGPIFTVMLPYKSLRLARLPVTDVVRN